MSTLDPDTFDDSTLPEDDSRAEDAEVPETKDDEKPAADAAAEPTADDDGAGAEGGDGGDADEKAGESVPAGDEATDVAEPPKHDHMMPKSRYDYQRDKRQEAEAREQDLQTRNEELQGRIKAVEAAQVQQVEQATKVHDTKVEDLEKSVSALDVEIEQLRLDGKAPEAAAKQSEIRKLERQITRLETKAPEVPDAGQIRDAALQQMRQEVALEGAIAELEAAHPMLKQGADDYDEGLVEEVLDLYDALMLKGKPPATAMRSAAQYVLGTGTASPAPTPAGSRKKEAVKRNLAAANAQPPDLSSAGSASDKAGATKPMDVMQMSIEEYESLGVDEDKFLN